MSPLLAKSCKVHIYTCIGPCSVLTVLNQGEISFVHNLLWHGASVFGLVQTYSNEDYQGKTFVSVFLTVYFKLLQCKSAGLICLYMHWPWKCRNWYIISFRNVFSCNKLMEEHQLQITNFKGPSETPSKERSLAIRACLRYELYRDYKNPPRVTAWEEQFIYKIFSPRMA